MNQMLPPGSSESGDLTPYAAPHAAAWESEEEEDGGLDIGRYISALYRHRWLLVACLLVGLGAAVAGYRMIDPQYRAQGSIWINEEEPGTNRGGPIAQSQLLQQTTAWIELLRSFAVLDPVVLEQRLYLSYPPEWSAAFDGFRLGERFAPGEYTLLVSEDGGGWALRSGEGLAIESGEPGDPIGADLGFEWRPEPGQLRPGAEIDFTVVSPRDASQRLSNQLETMMLPESNFLRVSLAGENPERITRVLSSVLERHVELAAQLKRSKADELTRILEEQLQAVEQDLRRAEQELETFRVSTVSLPSEQSAPIAAGLEQTRAPVFSEFFSRRMELEEVRTDIRRIEETIESLPEDGVRIEGLELIPAVRTSTPVRDALEELSAARAELRSLTQRYTDEYEPVRELRQRIETLETETIPDLLTSLLAQLRTRERELDQVIESRTEELTEIPPRTIEEARLRRRVDIANDLYVELRQRYETAKLAAASSIPDVRILDAPVTPQVPTSDPRIRFAALALLGFLGGGVGLVLVFDRFDSKVRYPPEVADAVGTRILGVIPRFRRGKKDNSADVLEAFREVRLQIDFAHGGSRPMVLAVTSPESGDGKTFFAANLAIVFSKLKRRVLLIDGDTRRGDIHELLGGNRVPGLTDHLEGKTDEAFIQATSHPNLHLVSSGARSVTSPDMLYRSAMQDFLAGVKSSYDVIVIDSPPLAAGADAFVLSTLAGSVILVLRSGVTDKQIAKAKAEPFLRLPVRVLGAVLNDIDEDYRYGAYGYQGYYIAGYEAGDEDERKLKKPSSPPPSPATAS